MPQRSTYNPPGPSFMTIVDIVEVGFLDVEAPGEVDAIQKVLMPPTFYEESRETVTYVYDTPQSRTASSGGTDESHVLIPPYVPGDLVLVAFTETGMVDLNIDGRAWARV